MERKLKPELSQLKVLTILSVLSVAFGVLSAFFGDLMICAAGALLAAVIVFEQNKRKIFSIATSVVLVISNIICFVPFGTFSLYAPEAIALAFIIALTFKYNFRKSTVAALLTATAVFFTLLTLIAFPMIEKLSFNFDAVKEFYTQMFESARADFISGVEKMLSSVSYHNQTAEQIMSTEDIGAVFDSFVNSLVSVVVIIGFLISGIALKIFSAVTNAISDNSVKHDEWRFTTTSLFAYFYIVLFIISTFIGLQSDAFSLTVINLYNIFMFVYAYVGLRAVYSMLRARKSFLFTVLILALAFMFLSVMSVQLLSTIGAAMTIITNKFSPDGEIPANEENKNQ